MINLEKIKQLELELKEQNIDSLLILSREDSDIVLPLLLDVHVVAQTAIFFNKNGSHIVLTGASDAGAYRSLGIFEVVVYEKDFSKSFKEIFMNIDITKLALNISENDYLVDGLTLGQYVLLKNIIGVDKLQEIECSSEAIIQKLRSIKTEQEIKYIKEAVEITTQIYDQVYKKIKVGMSETDIGDLFIEQMNNFGVSNALGSPMSPPLICINRCGLAHREPNGKNILQKGDILICDFSVLYKGYCSDIARSFYVLNDGEISAPEDIQKAFDTAVSAVSNVIENMKQGMKGFEVDALGRKVIEDAGYPTIPHSVGHQVGKKVHDGGTILGQYRSDRPSVCGELKVNEVYAIEPTVIQGGLPSFIVEENVVIRETKIEVLSKRQTELYLIKDE